MFPVGYLFHLLLLPYTSSLTVRITLRISYLCYLLLLPHKIQNSHYNYTNNRISMIVTVQLKRHLNRLMCLWWMIAKFNNSIWFIGFIFHNWEYFSSFEAGNCVSNSSFKWMKNRKKQFNTTRVYNRISMSSPHFALQNKSWLLELS